MDLPINCLFPINVQDEPPVDKLISRMSGEECELIFDNSDDHSSWVKDAGAAVAGVALQVGYKLFQVITLNLVRLVV